MKKLLTIAALIGATSMSFGQGNFSFANTGTTQVSTNTVHNGPGTGGTSPVFGSYYYGVFIAGSTVTNTTGVSDASWAFSGVYGSNSAAASGGRFNMGVQTISGFIAGTTVSLLVRGWSSDLGQNWSSVLNWYNNGSPTTTTEWFGTSAVATSVTLGGGAIGTPSIFGNNPGQISTGFLLNRIDPVPEPSTFALAGLGAAAMLIFRRRKQ